MPTFSLNLPLETALFVRRPNRFVMYISIDGNEFGASVPNPGKMQELLFPGVKIAVTPMDTERVKYPYRVVAVENSRGEWLMLDTIRNNDCAAWLIKEKQVPSLKEYSLLKREVTVGKSRFDLLLEKEGKELYCEVKSCTLFGGELAMFPDAVTDRGRRHVQELGDMAREGIPTAVLFLVHSSKVTGFTPDFHTDPAFSETLYQNRNDLPIIPISIGWDETMSLEPEIKEIPIRWDLYEQHGRTDAGQYLYLLKNETAQDIAISDGSLVHLPQGFLLYVGKADSELSKQLTRHSRTRKGAVTDFDYIRNVTSVAGSWPVRSAVGSHCVISQEIKSFADSIVNGVAIDNCQCESHLFYFEKNPTRTRNLQDLILKVRMEDIL